MWHEFVNTTNGVGSFVGGGGACTLADDESDDRGGASSGSRFYRVKIGDPFMGSRVDTNSIPYSWITTVAGRPMVAYVSGGTVVRLAAMQDWYGSGTWTSRVVRMQNLVTYVAVAEVQGRPALVHDNNLDPGGYSLLWYAINTAADGSGSWIFHQVSDQLMSYYPGAYNSLAVVNGMPATAGVSYHPFGPYAYYELQYYICDQAEGTGYWTRTVVDSGNDHIQSGELTLLQGKPAIAYMKKPELKLAVSPTASGSGTWNICTVPGVGLDWTRPSLIVTDGRPAIASRDTNAGGRVIFTINSAADGSGSWTTQVVGTNVGYQVHAAVINGRPAIAWVDAGASQVRYAVNTKPDGSGTWRRTAVAAAAPLDLAEVFGQAAVTCNTTTNGFMWFR